MAGGGGQSKIENRKSKMPNTDPLRGRGRMTEDGTARQRTEYGTTDDGTTDDRGQKTER
jgi:hypothetical protein